MQEGRLVRSVAPGAGQRAAAADEAWRRFARAESLQEFAQAWLALQCAQIGEVGDGVVLLRQPGAELLAPAAFHPRHPPDRALFAQVIERALAEGRGVVLPRLARPGTAAPGTEDEPVAYQLALPLLVDTQVLGAVGLEIAQRSDPEVRAAMRSLQWGSGWLEAWLRRQMVAGAAVSPAEGGGERQQLALDLVATLLEHQRLAEGGPAFVTELASRLHCDRVALGLRQGPRTRLKAMSHSSQVAAQGNLTRAIEDAMDEALDQHATVGFPAAEDDSAPLVRFAHQQLAQASGAGAVLTLPLRRGEQQVGALTLERATGQGFDPATLELCAAVAAVAGPLVALQEAGERGLLAHAGADAVRLRDGVLGPRHAGWKLAGAAALLVVLFFVFATGDWRVTADSTVEGEILRSASAPINGFIKDAPHRAGDAVRKGTVIARLDDRDLRVERAKLLSQVEQYGGQYREATAGRERAQALMASSQLEQARAQLALVEEQIARTVLVAPFDAVIVTGDLSQKLGAPVERGQSLFELAPLSSFRVALMVDEHDFAAVQPGQRGKLTVNSMPGASFPFEVTKVTAVNEARDGKNTFRVEAKMVGDYGRLRPGMKGVGKIEIGERNLAWIWTHSLVDRIRLWFWLWLP
ncbi:HlyD family efflux transporter periplasmic adaptor subunit [Ramlibacter sp. XY19]|uniref:HlyD family efflux transporter periplasmic adaptor subunit n=1 Tax=Ramlibacter paludis TaxID=2908000 RepID=UPI0023DC0FF1|nr:HlyD family efflux transporter periplasmic adaptor subunit [Ramlibacter paludis]MCG2593740.1 HlyD family efflux transporter periplasmic adaptor subunit [Ramlibacter paludis]